MESIRDKAAVFRYVPIQVPGKGWTVVKAIGSKRLGRTYENAGFPETYTLAQAQLAAQNALRDMKQNPEIHIDVNSHNQREAGAYMKNPAPKKSSFMQLPKLKPGYVWMDVSPLGSGAPQWEMQPSPHYSTEGKIFGYDEKEFMARQYKKNPLPKSTIRYVPIQVPGKGWTVVKVIGSKRLGRTYENAGFPETYTLAQAQLAAQNALRDMKQNPVARRKPKTDQDIFDMAETRGGRTGLAIGKRKHAYAVIDNYVQINQKTKQNIGKHNASILAEFPFTKIGKANAIQYARAYHRYAPRHDLAVIKT